MCLSTVNKEIVKKGYKIGEIVRGMFHAYQDPMPLNVWMTANCVRVLTSDDDKQYTSGFHIFTSKRDAKRYLAYLRKHYNSFAKTWELFECEYSGVLAEGTEKLGLVHEDNCPYVKVTIAARMKIIRSPMV